MLFAEKGNKVKEIDESMIESCVSQGFKIVDERGRLIQDTIPMDMPTLKLAYKNHEDTIKKLKAENTELKAGNAELTAKVARLEAELQEAKAKPVQEVASKTSKKSSKSMSEE